METMTDPKTMTHAELSAWLAEHLMGWRLIEEPAYFLGIQGKYIYWVKPDKTRIAQQHWSPPTNIQQAMEDVVRSMCDKGYACTLYPSLLRASFGSQDMRHFGQTKAESWEQYPRAICEAAYLALVERGDE